MADNPIDGNAGTLNEGTVEPGFDRTEPLIDVDRFRKEFLFGIPLKSFLTGETVSDDTLKHFIAKGVGDFETSVRIPVQPVKIENEKHDFQRADDLMFGPRQLMRWPVLKVEKIAALFPGRVEGTEVDYPTSWVTIQGDTGFVRIVPNSGSLVNADISFIASTGYRSILLGGIKAWPNLWRFTYWAGFDRDKIPVIVNELIGTMAALKFLSMLGPVLFPVQSYAVGIDGMSQSTATLGPAFLAQRLAELTAERDRLVMQLKDHYCTNMVWGAF